MSVKKSDLKHHGFTLLEVLVALFIFAIVSMIMMGALHNIINTQSAVEKKSDRFAELQIALLLLSHDTEQAINRTITNSDNQPEGFLGGKNILVFTRAGLVNPFGELSRSTLQRVRYQTVKGELQRITWPTLDRTPKTPFDKRVLISSVKNVKFEYLDKDGRFQKAWPPSDLKEETLPRGIRMTLTLNDLGSITQFYIIPGQPLDKTP